MKILVTGAIGFIGSHLVRELAGDDNEIFAIVRDMTQLHDEISSLCHTVYYGDLRDFAFLRRVISESEAEHVYHLASCSIVRMCARDPIGAYQTNVMGTVNLLEAIRQSGDNVKRVVVSTSDKVYGHAEPPYTEETAFVPKYTYEATKACQDFVCQNFFHNYDVPVSVIRLGNVYGPGDPNNSRLIPNTIRKALSGKSPVIYESVAEFRREFVFIDDAVSALLTIADTGTAGEAYCVGGLNEEPPTIREIVGIILEACGNADLKIDYPKKHQAFKEIRVQYMNASKIREIGWSPRFNITDGIIETVESYLEDSK